MASMMLQAQMPLGPSGMPEFGGEGKALLAKSAMMTARQAYRPLEMAAGTLICLLTFSMNYLIMCLDFRHKYGSGVAHAVALGPLSFVSLILFLLGRIRRRRMRSARPLYAVAVTLLGSAVAGCVVGNRVWYSDMSQHYVYHDMGTYVNLDPAKDEGGAFMDAAIVYFKESSFVLTKKALAFHNGRTYCVAPIVREYLELQNEAEATATGRLFTDTHYSLPAAGTVDFWAVGTDCCGKTGTDGDGFTCGDTRSKVARSGLRLLDNTERSNYLLAVQEWSATIGLPVRHPLFFTWTKDPVSTLKRFGNKAWEDLVFYQMYAILFGLLGQLLIHMTCKSLRIF